MGMGMGMAAPGIPTFMPLMPSGGMGGSPGGPTEIMLAAMAANGGGGGGGGGGMVMSQGKQPIKMTNIDFAGKGNTDAEGG